MLLIIGSHWLCANISITDELRTRCKIAVAATCSRTDRRIMGLRSPRSLRTPRKYPNIVQGAVVVRVYGHG